MKLILALALIGLLSGCAGSEKKAEPLVSTTGPADSQQAEFDRGLQAMEAENYPAAAKIFESLLLKKPGTDLDLVTLYNLGSAYEGMGQCDKASERFRQVVRSSANQFKRIESESLFRLSLMYECLGQDQKAIAALLDAKRRGKSLPPETLNAQIPARLAAAYARIGNRQKALEYFSQASRGLKSVVSKGSARLPLDLITKTLFLMGRLSPMQRRADGDPIAYIQSLSMQQPYLLQCVEMHRPPWSAQAEEELKTAYQTIWNFKFKDSEERREFLTRSMQVIQELRKIRMPKPDAAQDSIFAVIDKTETQVQNELLKGGETTPLTPDAERREGLKREGRLVDPTPAPKKTQKR